MPLTGADLEAHNAPIAQLRLSLVFLGVNAGVKIAKSAHLVHVFAALGFRRRQLAPLR